MSGIKRGGDFRRVAKLRAIDRIRILPIAISAIISWPVKTTGAAPDYAGNRLARCPFPGGHSRAAPRLARSITPVYDSRNYVAIATSRLTTNQDGIFLVGGRWCRHASGRPSTQLLEVASRNPATSRSMSSAYYRIEILLPQRTRIFGWRTSIQIRYLIPPGQWVIAQQHVSRLHRYPLWCNRLFSPYVR